jgi:TPR repeat protein
MLHKPLSLACAPFIRAALLSAALAYLPALPAFANPQAIAPGEQVLPEEERIKAFQAGVAAYDAGDYARAYEIWLPLAKLGDLAAQRNVGHLLRLGRGTARDLPRALYFYERAADAGLNAAALNAGTLLLGAEGIERDTEDAADYFMQAAQDGYPEALYQLALLTEAGDGTGKDPAKADRLMRLAAFLGHEKARARIGLDTRLDEVRAPSNVS